MALVVVTICLAAALLFWRLSQGPIVTGIGTGWLSRHLAEHAGSADATADIGVVGFGLSDALDPRLILRDIRIVRPGDIAVSVDEVEATMSWATLAGGPISVSSVKVGHLHVTNIGPLISLPTMADIARATDRLVTRGELREFELESFTFRQALPDKPQRDILSGVAFSALVDPGQSLRIQAMAKGIDGRLSLDLAAVPAGAGTYALRLLSKGFDIADLLTIAGKSDAPLSGSLALDASLSLAPDGRITAGGGSLDIGTLTLAAGDSVGDVVPKPVHLELAWDPQRQALRLDPSPIVFETGHVLVDGSLGLPATKGGTWPFGFDITGTDLLSPGQRIEGRVDGQYEGAGSLLALDDVRLQGAGASLSASIRLSHDEAHPFVVASAMMPELPLASLRTVWPLQIAEPVRRWIEENVSAGTLTDLSFDLSAPLAGKASPMETAALAFSFREGVFRSYPGGPLVRDAVGHARLKGRRFELTLDNGWADLGDGRRMDLTASTFVVPDVATEPARAEIGLNLAGSASSALALWQTLPMAARSDITFDPAKATGTAEAHLTIGLPLEADIPEDAIAADGQVLLSDFAPGTPQQGRTIRKANLVIDLKDHEAIVTGKAEVDGSLADIDLAFPLDDQGEVRSTVELVLDDAARKAQGINLGDMLTGPVAVRVEAKGDPEGTSSIDIDLARAAASVPLLGFTKASGKSGKLSFDLRQGKDGISISGLAMKIARTEVQGAIQLDSGGNLVSASFPKFNVGDGDRLSLNVTRDGDDIAVKLTGSKFDARSLVAGLIKATAKSDVMRGQNFEVAATIDSVTGFNGEQLRGLNLSARIRDGHVAAMSLSVQSDGGGATSATLTPGDGRDMLRVEVGEVGRLLRFLDIYARVFGGRATVSGYVSDNGELRAAVDGANWQVVEEPGLARLSTASASGPTSGLSTANLRRLEYEIHLEDGVLQIDRGFVRADTAGLTMSGDVDFGKGALRLAGTYLPATQIDSLLSKIPILGQTIFAGGGRSGLLGVSYRLTGPIDEPTLSVNPLSVVAPGILKKLFEMR